MKRARLVFVATALLGVATGGAASTAAPIPAELNGPEAQAAPAVQVPSGNKLVAKFYAKGVQTYTCTAGAWKSL
jgi:allophanate hydrolase subunit 2